MTAKFLLVAITLLLPLHAYAQDRIRSVRVVEEPRTKLEHFASKTGTVVVTIFSAAGTLKAANETLVHVETRAMRDATTGEKQAGLAIRIEEAGGSPGETQALIDAEEIEPLLKAIDHISAIEKGVTKQANFRADFRTRGDFELSAYSAPEGHVTIALGTGRIGGMSGSPGAGAYLDFLEVANFRKIIAAAQAALRTMPQP